METTLKQINLYNGSCRNTSDMHFCDEICRNSLALHCMCALLLSGLMCLCMGIFSTFSITSVNFAKMNDYKVCGVLSENRTHRSGGYTPGKGFGILQQYQFSCMDAVASYHFVNIYLAVP